MDGFTLNTKFQSWAQIESSRYRWAPDTVRAMVYCVINSAKQVRPAGGVYGRVSCRCWRCGLSGAGVVGRGGGGHLLPSSSTLLIPSYRIFHLLYSIIQTLLFLIDTKNGNVQFMYGRFECFLPGFECNKITWVINLLFLRILNAGFSYYPMVN